MDMLATLENSFVYLLVLAGGYVLKRVHVLPKKSAGILSTIIMNITLPAAILKGASASTFDLSILWVLFFAVVLNILLLGSGYWFSRGRPGPERGLMVLNVNTFNYGNFAIPFLSSMVSGETFAFMGVYDLDNAFFAFGPNLALAQKAMERKDKKITLLDVLRKLFTTPTIWAYIIMLSLGALQWKLPALIMDVVSMAGAANAFLAMLCVGILFEFRLPKSGYTLIWQTLLIRYVICSLVAVAIWFFLPAPPEAVRTLVVMTMAPIASCAPILTVEAGCDGTTAAVINSISIVFSIVVMILLLLLLPMPVRG